MSRYNGAIVDVHHHFWEPGLGKQPWLLPDAHIPFRYGDYEPIKRSYLPPDLLADAAGLKIVDTVTMETEWNLDDPVGEMLYTQQLHDHYGLPGAAVAHAILADPDVESVLEQLAQIPLVKSVRNKPGQADSPSQVSSHPSKLIDPQWRRGFSLLGKYGLHFDLQVAWYHFAEALDLAQAFPEQLIIINHAGLPADRSQAAMDGWSKAIQMMSQMENVAIKISGIGVPGQAWTAAANRPIVETIAEHFGVDRIMFASNFPVDSLCATYQEIYHGFLEITEQWSRSDQERVFALNAIETYGLSGNLMSADRATGIVRAH